MEVKKYKKRPVVIEALKFTYGEQGIADLKAFCGGKLISWGKDRSLTAVGWAQIGTLEDGGSHAQAKHIATEGDYIIKGAFGEFYPCKPDIFLATYEEA
jgi:hypothetical protein